MRLYCKFNKLLIIIFLSVLSYCILAFGNEKGSSLNNDIHNILNNNRRKYDLPGISLSYQLPNSKKINNDVSGYYSLSTNKKITPKTLFQIGSITKTFTASIIFKLMEENKLTGNDHLTKWLPEYSRWKNITIYDLLHHTSGVYNYSSGQSFDDLLRKNSEKYWSLNELANIAYKHPDLYPPGKKNHYTNTDYILLGLIIEKVTNKTIQQVFDDYLKQYHLHDTFYSPAEYPNLIKNRIAHGYNRDGTFKFNTDVTFVSMSYSQSAGAMISTPNDLVKWLNDLFTGKIINTKSLNDMTRIISLDNAKYIANDELHITKKPTSSKPFIELGIGAGIGLVYLKNNGMTWMHSGGMPGYESLFAYSPCSGIYLVLTYNVKPKQQFIFIKMADEIFKKLNSTPNIAKAIKAYRRSHSLPNYCNSKSNFNP